MCYMCGTVQIFRAQRLAASHLLRTVTSQPWNPTKIRTLGIESYTLEFTDLAASSNRPRNLQVPWLLNLGPWALRKTRISQRISQVRRAVMEHAEKGIPPGNAMAAMIVSEETFAVCAKAAGPPPATQLMCNGVQTEGRRGTFDPMEILEIMWKQHTHFRELEHSISGRFLALHSGQLNRI